MESKYNYHVNWFFMSMDEWNKVTKVKDVEHVFNMR